MKIEIAVLIGEDEKTSGFEKDGVIVVYEKGVGEWNVKKEIDYAIKDISDTFAFHNKINELCKELDTCKIIVVNRIRGIHYIAFEEHQISMLEISGNPMEFLDHIEDCGRHERTKQEISLEPHTIYERQPGKFDTDLRDVMNGKTSYNSKQILVPFLKKETFTILEVLCDHVPKWLEREKEALNVEFTIENYKNCIKIKIYPHKKSKKNM